MDKSKFLGLCWTDVSIYEQLHMWASKWLRCPPSTWTYPEMSFLPWRWYFTIIFQKSPSLHCSGLFLQDLRGQLRLLLLIRRRDPSPQYFTRHQIFCLARGMQNTVLSRDRDPDSGRANNIDKNMIKMLRWNFFNKFTQLLTHQQPCRRRWSDPSDSRCGIHTCTLPSGWCRSDCKCRDSCTHRYLQKRSRKANHEACVKKEQLYAACFIYLLNASVWIIKSFYGGLNSCIVRVYWWKFIFFKNRMFLGFLLHEIVKWFEPRIHKMQIKTCFNCRWCFARTLDELLSSELDVNLSNVFQSLVIILHPGVD